MQQKRLKKTKIQLEVCVFQLKPQSTFFSPETTEQYSNGLRATQQHRLRAFFVASSHFFSMAFEQVYSLPKLREMRRRKATTFCALFRVPYSRTPIQVAFDCGVISNVFQVLIVRSHCLYLARGSGIRRVEKKYEWKIVNRIK